MKIQIKQEFMFYEEASILHVLVITASGLCFLNGQKSYKVRRRSKTVSFHRHIHNAFL